MLLADPASGPASARIFSSASRSVCGGAAHDVAQVEGVGLQPRLGRRSNFSIVALPTFSISGSMYEASAPNFA